MDFVEIIKGKISLGIELSSTHYKLNSFSILGSAFAFMEILESLSLMIKTRGSQEKSGNGQSLEILRIFFGHRKFCLEKAK